VIETIKNNEPITPLDANNINLLVEKYEDESAGK
jgi:hypothetical protein